MAKGEPIKVWVFSNPPHRLARLVSAGWLTVLACLARKKSAKSRTSASNGSGKDWTASKSRSEVVDIVFIRLILTIVVYVLALFKVHAAANYSSASACSPRAMRCIKSSLSSSAFMPATSSRVVLWEWYSSLCQRW